MAFIRLLSRITRQDTCIDAVTAFVMSRHDQLPFVRSNLLTRRSSSEQVTNVRGGLDVNEHEVVPTREPTHGWLPVETRVRSRAIVVLQPARQDPAAIGRGIVRPPVRPLAQRRLDEPLGFAVRARGVGPSATVAHAQRAAGGPKAPRA